MQHTFRMYPEFDASELQQQLSAAEFLPLPSDSLPLHVVLRVLGTHQLVLPIALLSPKGTQHEPSLSLCSARHPAAWSRPPRLSTVSFFHPHWLVECITGTPESPNSGFDIPYTLIVFLNNKVLILKYTCRMPVRIRGVEPSSHQSQLC